MERELAGGEIEKDRRQVRNNLALDEVRRVHVETTVRRQEGKNMLRIPRVQDERSMLAEFQSNCGQVRKLSCDAGKYSVCVS
jgi:hypothetical protein